MMRSTFVGLLILASASTAYGHGYEQFKGNGTSSTDAAILTAINEFRAALGAQNPNEATVFTGGRREINWDAVPDGSSSPNAFPGDFFNGSATGRARGIVFTTPGTGFEVSANSNAATPEFGNINAAYTGNFAPFSTQKLFTPIGSNITDITFRVPSDQISPASVRGFGAIFTDVDTNGSTTIECFDLCGDRIFRGTVRAGTTPNEHFSFLGVVFSSHKIGRVRITSGATALSDTALDTATDVVAMDDFIYGEPKAIEDANTNGTPDDCEFSLSNLGNSPCGSISFGLFTAGMLLPCLLMRGSRRRRR